MNRLKSSPIVDVLVNSRGPVPEGASEYAQEKVLAAIAHVSSPVLAVRAQLTQAANPSASRPATAQAVVDVNGHPVRAHVAADTMFEAVDLLQDRLTARLARTRRHIGPEHRGGPAAEETSRESRRHGHYPDRQQPPTEERRIVRHKSFSLGCQTPEDAAIDLESMSYDFWLFTDMTSGRDSVVYRDGRTGRHRVASVGAGSPAHEAGPLLSVSSAPVPECSVDEAVQRMRLTGLPFVFFADLATGRGGVLYHRYDGHYGLITPAR
ncbi:HPF/RaiA family ribosome-associated protein [Streptomyces lunaelactis]|uniref:ribosome hibernation promotion factor n=1 Tax=Streptomyces lunaelactis TaxID=1535768 RepID=UPI0015857B96|nr:HPF/RaiA family ribosome-associated protein [Streptomyces lunaelactis]NUK00486.1 HPF/RaiA family ribosome-associated protein [Streptomyces lunaelactis]NUK10134.1 HPF/RaiA family ribosome-associated protein [Streptomyces lunaelactis]NUK15760.1 HPF/RaiA family ribosome-associated protein [Streptomyces lunaelactis]NUK28011.1 HPF/RaiA family ribosome-associated protein [Streptomyces lunaelactis]NUK36459.1 HPF/RaiA family ribosome-associated protein [Streptomyces lunaelactis]